jgi:predicted O-methyltransferase YrrM
MASAFLHYLRCKFGIDSPNTQTSTRERETIKKYAQGAGTAVEIGVFEGVNTVTIASSINDSGKLYAIDPFFKGRLGICYYEKIAKMNLKRNKVFSKVQVLPMFSQDAVDKVPVAPDFIFIDGDHSVEGITRDWHDWSARLKPGGIIALHDTSIPAHDSSVERLGSYQYFESHIKHDGRFTIVETTDSLNVLRKNL